MIDYNKEKGKQFQTEIRKLTVQVKSDIKNNDVSETKIQDKINFYENQYDRYKVLLLDPGISPDLILFKDEILKLKDQLKKPYSGI